MPARTAQAGLAAPQLRPAATAQPMQRRIGLFHSGLPHGSCSQIGTFCVSRSSPRYMTSPIRIRSDFLPERWTRLDGDRRRGPGGVRGHSTSHIDMHSGDTLFSRSCKRVGTRPRRPLLTSFRSRAVVAATTSQRGCRRLGRRLCAGRPSGRCGCPRWYSAWWRAADPRRHYPAAGDRVRLGVRSQGAQHRGVRRRGPQRARPDVRAPGRAGTSCPAANRMPDDDHKASKGVDHGRFRALHRFRRSHTRP